MLRTLQVAALLSLMGLVTGCPSAPHYAMDAPPSFKRYEKTEAFKMITADGVMLKVREVVNYPKADLAFWADALERHLEARGYARKSGAEFETRKGLAGHTIDFVLPRGVEDWVMSETIFVVEDRVVLVEVAGPFARYAPVEAELKEALKTFDPDA